MRPLTSPRFVRMIARAVGAGPAGDEGMGSVIIRNVMLLAAVIFFVVAFFVMSDGCVGYETLEGGSRSCIDPSGVGQIVSQAAHLLFAGLAILSAALMDHAALFGSDRPAS
jgi:hypothetical protein